MNVYLILIKTKQEETEERKKVQMKLGNIII